MKALSLCSGAKSNFRDRVLGEVEKNSFIALPGKGDQSRLMPSKCVSQPGGCGEDFHSNGSNRA